MKRLTMIAVVLLAAGCWAFTARTQDMKKAEAPKPALGPSAALLEEWNDVGRRLIAIAEDMPEDKYDYKPKPEMRSWVGQLLHAAQGSYYFINPVLGKPFPKDDPDMAELKTRAQIVAFVKKCFADGAEVIKAQGDAGMSKTVDAGGQLTRIDALGYGLTGHANEHYGQIVVYYRLNGLVPPESRPKK
jgi:DinB superfamily